MVSITIDLPYLLFIKIAFNLTILFLIYQHNVITLICLLNSKIFQNLEWLIKAVLVVKTFTNHNDYFPLIVE